MNKSNLSEARSILQKLLEAENYPSEEVDRLLIRIYGLSKTADLYNLNDTTMSIHQQRLFGQICLHLKANQPIAYIVGYQDFSGLRFTITQKVLVPRYETEKLVITDHLWDLLQKNKIITLVDVGTGSGNVIISNYYHLVKKALQTNKEHLLKNIQFFAIDLDSDALAIANENAKNLLAQFKNNDFPSIKMMCGHLLEPLTNKLTPNNKNHQTIIVANLPYIPREVYQTLDKSVKREPLIAISPPKGTNLVQQLIDSAPQGTELFLEDYNAKLPTKFEIKFLVA